MQSDSVAVKVSQLRLTSQRLGQVQAKNDSQANITRTDIATLLQRDNVPLAREKAEKLIMDEAYGDLLEEIEMQIGVLLEKYNELERQTPPSPVMIEAISTIIYATPYVHSKDLDAIRKYLIDLVGPDFARSAAGNRDHHVSKRVLKAISAPIPSAFQLDGYLEEIAMAYGVSWNPEPAPQNIINSLSEALDVEASPEVDLRELRRLCSQGIPDEPAWLRPRIWKLFFGVISIKKASWKTESLKHREAYYDLVRRLLEPFSRAQTSHTPHDDTLLSVYKQLSGLPRNIFALLEDEPDSSLQCPLHENAPESIRIIYANDLESRVKTLLHQANDASDITPTPEIRLESDADTTPGISLTPAGEETAEDSTSTTLLPSRKCLFGNAHPKHCSSLLRLLYLHSTINPGGLSYHTASILVPLLSALTQEVELDDIGHVEADTFWLLEAVLAEFSGLEDDDGRVWMKNFSERLAWADFEFSSDLESRSLDPALPHYSYRWLMPLLTHTLPLPSLFLTWDAIFSRPPRERGSYPKLDYLVDVCTSMLLRSKNHLFRLWNTGRTTRSLWSTETSVQSPANGQDSFMEVLSFLQNYDLRYVGGVERIIQTASELYHRRQQQTVTSQQPSLSLGARLKVNMWKGFGSAPNPTYDASSIDKKRDSSDYADGDETETSETIRKTTLASRVSDTVWRGITNRSAMDDENPSAPPSPVPPTSPNTHAEKALNVSSSPPAQSSSLWNYAEKLKDSDAVATISKVSTNWRVKGILGGWGMSKPNSPTTSSGNEKEPIPHVEQNMQGRRGSLPFLHSPTMIPPPSALSSPDVGFRSPELSPPLPNSGLIGKTKSLISRASQPATPKSAPRPLLLGTSTFVTPSPRDSVSSKHPRSASTGTRTPDTDEWAEVMKAKRQHFNRDSQSSVSSLSPSDAFGRTPKSTRSDRESDSSSRIVSINRRSVSPMAPSFRIGQARSSSRASSVSSSGFSSPPLLAKSPLQESSLIEDESLAQQARTRHVLQSFSTLDTSLQSRSYSEKESDSDVTSSELPVPTRKPSWKKNIENNGESEDTANSTSAGVPVRAPRVRSKRYPRPANLQIQDDKSPRYAAEQKTPSPSTLKVEWPGEYENVATPRATSFDSDDAPGIPKSPRRSRKISTGDGERPRKLSTDTYREERPRKLSSGRTRKVSTESREVPRARRESAAEEGDDEGYDELLSAYESEDAPNVSTR
ncbi:TBC domain-containing protein [Psilocybe cubensis]|uniref:TBC domain-containing protein n=2 Tax=Psilocybe cubensis TaxID=181762 RepID=A0ACB8H8B7_PSICU|nr:TBC domain-containing protein [Psilocybe cubensis]KAH9484248.1 TBC domain-containing protein [Psilocybe cubensis]